MNFKRVLYLIILTGYLSGGTLFAVEKYSLRQLSESNPEATVSYMFANGVKYYILGQQREANATFSDIIKLDPSHAPSYFYLMRLRADNEDYEQALEYINVAVALDSSNSQYREALGRMLLGQDDMQGAKKVYDQLLAQNPNASDNYIIAAAIAQMTGDTGRVLELAEIYESRWGLDPRLVDIKRMALVNTKRYYEARDYMAQLAGEFPTEPLFRIQLAELNATLRQDTLALENYHIAIGLDPTNPGGYFALSEYYRIKGDMSQSLKTLLPVFRSRDADPAMKIMYADQYFFHYALYPANYKEVNDLVFAMMLANPEDPKVLSIYGRFLMFVGRLDEAAAFYRNKIEEGVADYDAYQRIIDIELFGNQNYDSAYYYINKGLEVFPQQYELYTRLSTLRWKQDDKKQALKELDKAEKVVIEDIDRSKIYAIRGDLCYEMGNSKKAFAAYKKAIKLDPDNSMALNNYAYYLSLMNKDMELALEMSIRSNDLSPSNPTYLDTYAWILHVMGRDQEALNIMRQTIALSSTESPELLFHYAEILYGVGEDFLARTYWQRAGEAGYDNDIIQQRLAFPQVNKNTEKDE